MYIYIYLDACINCIYMHIYIHVLCHNLSMHADACASSVARADIHVCIYILASCICLFIHKPIYIHTYLHVIFV